MARRAHGWAGMHLKGRHPRTFCRRVVRIVLLVGGDALGDIIVTVVAGVLIKLSTRRRLLVTLDLDAHGLDGGSGLELRHEISFGLEQVASAPSRPVVTEGKPFAGSQRKAERGPPHSKA